MRKDADKSRCASGLWESLHERWEIEVLVYRMLSRDIPQSTHVISVFTGYGFELAAKAYELHRKFKAPIFITGKDSRPFIGNPNAKASDYKNYLMDSPKKREDGISENAILVDDNAKNTKEQSENLSDKIISEQWKIVFLVTAAYHLPRAYMTLLASLIDKELDETVKIIAIPIQKPWMANDPVIGKSWFDVYCSEERPRISTYQKKGDVASWEELKQYLNRHGF